MHGCLPATAEHGGGFEMGGVVSLGSGVNVLLPSLQAAARPRIETVRMKGALSPVTRPVRPIPSV